MENNGNRGRFFETLPVLSFFGYWLYAGLISAVMAHDTRLLKLSVITLPVLIAMGVALWKIFNPPSSGNDRV